MGTASEKKLKLEKKKNSHLKISKWSSQQSVFESQTRKIFLKAKLGKSVRLKKVVPILLFLSSPAGGIRTGNSPS